VITAIGTTTAGMIRFFIFDGGSSTRAWRHLSVAAATPSATVKTFTDTIISPDVRNPLLILPVGYVLRAGTVNAESFDIVAHAGDF
jgi:hypothetical protein